MRGGGHRSTLYSKQRCRTITDRGQEHGMQALKYYGFPDQHCTLCATPYITKPCDQVFLLCPLLSDAATSDSVIIYHTSIWARKSGRTRHGAFYGCGVKYMNKPCNACSSIELKSVSIQKLC